MGESIYVLQYFHGGKFRTTQKFEYVNGLIEKFQVDPNRLSIWDILGNVELLGYSQHKYVYYRDPDSDFNCDGLVLIHNDERVRQVIQLLVTKGIVDIYVDHKVEEDDGSPKVNDATKVNVEGAVIEALETDTKGLKVVGVEGYYDMGPEIEDLEAVGEELRTTLDEFVLEPVTDGGPNVVVDGEDHTSDVGARGAIDDDGGPMGDADDGPMGDADGPVGDVDGFDLDDEPIGDGDGPMGDADGFNLDDGPMEDTGGVKEAADGADEGPSVVVGVDGGPNVDSDSDSTTEDENDKESFLHNIEITSDVDEELDNIRRNMKNSKRRRKTIVDAGNEDTDDAMVGDDVVDEIEPKENDGKLEGNESEYLDSSEPGEYGGSDESEAEVCGTFVGQKTVGPRYDPNCSIPTWELGQGFVDLKKLSCTCREWELTGIPCCPAICAIFHDSKSLENYVSEWYKKEKYMATYKHVLQPVRGKKFWPKGLPPILPPTVKVQPGRPKKKRTKAKDEPKKIKVGKFTKAGARMRCSKCRTLDHNIQNCPQKSTNVATSQVHTNEIVNRASQPHEPISIGQTHVTKSTTVPSGSQQTHVHRPRTRSMSLTGNEANNSNHGQPSNKRKRSSGIGLYTNLRTGEQIFNSGLGFQTTVTPPTNAPKKIGASTSQFDHTWKGPGLSWKGKKAVSTRQLQQELSDASRKHPQIRMTQ
ncbi:hypothetical protein GQ457_08G026870 [Hibiscus cannabinus]